MKVKLLELGPPAMILKLALEPPGMGDVKRTILMLKEVVNLFFIFVFLLQVSLFNSNFLFSIATTVMLLFSTSTKGRCTDRETE